MKKDEPLGRADETGFYNKPGWFALLDGNIHESMRAGSDSAQGMVNVNKPD